MTLVIANRVNKLISFSSDSRITFGSHGYIDFGVKIFSVPVKIYSPTDSSTGITSLKYDFKLGLAVIGSSINAYTVKESVYEMLQSLQYVPGRTDLSMESISKLIFKVYQKACHALAPILGKNGLCQLILGGYCPKKNKIRIFEYSVILNGELNFTLKEILENDNILFYGSGTSAAQILKNSNHELGPLHIIKKIIDGGQISTVGGGLQYGEFVDNNFKIYGIENYALNAEGSFKEYLHTLRGINLYKDEFEREENDFHISYTFKQPFKKEINDAMMNFLKKN